MTTADVVAKSAALQRCLNSPYLRIDESKRGLVSEELQAARDFYQQAAVSFDEADEATAFKQVWAAMFRAARALVYQAGYNVDQLRCMEVVLRVHYPGQITAEDIGALQQAQELVGPREAAMERGRRFLEQATALAQVAA